MRTVAVEPARISSILRQTDCQHGLLVLVQFYPEVAPKVHVDLSFQAYQPASQAFGMLVQDFLIAHIGRQIDVRVVQRTEEKTIGIEDEFSAVLTAQPAAVSEERVVAFGPPRGRVPGSEDSLESDQGDRERLVSPSAASTIRGTVVAKASSNHRLRFLIPSFFACWTGALSLQLSAFQV